MATEIIVRGIALAIYAIILGVVIYYH